MAWKVEVARPVSKGLRKLPASVHTALAALIMDMEDSGPVRGDWPNYSRLGPGRHHCHLKKGRPTYVAVWEERPGHVRLIEVTYVGTHEKAPY